MMMMMLLLLLLLLLLALGEQWAASQHPRAELTHAANAHNGSPAHPIQPNPTQPARSHGTARTAPLAWHRLRGTAECQTVERTKNKTQ